jgi:hypothetical protein
MVEMMMSSMPARLAAFATGLLSWRRKTRRQPKRRRTEVRHLALVTYGVRPEA